ncbi:DUF4249 domain-containing protein [Spirosoma sp. 209]|uniref:DUF4249 domain-containing protein n=1 Tax=Spirosoma sp. 209 TaxID=1955701 RepID=UPI00098D6060|nr:DUF4249 domain-containing protein [Spirosoma sp. 209]
MVRAGLVFFFSWLLVGCLKTTDSIDPNRLAADRQSKLYVLCFISPQDTLLTAKVAMSEPQIIATLEPTLLVKTATVTLSDGQASIPLLYSDSLGYYVARPLGRFRIRAGQTYQLTVSMGDDRRVQATATVPPAIPIGQVRIDSSILAQTGNRTSIRYTTTIDWASPGGLNYYRGWGELTQTIQTQQGRLPETRISRPDFFVLRENNTGPGPYSTTGSFTLTVAPGSLVRTARTRFGLFNTDQNYYQYHATLREQLNTPNSLFAGTPVLFSNMEGGYGVFAAYNATYISR